LNPDVIGKTAETDAEKKHEERFGLFLLSDLRVLRG